MTCICKHRNWKRINVLDVVDSVVESDTVRKVNKPFSTGWVMSSPIEIFVPEEGDDFWISAVRAWRCQNCKRIMLCDYGDDYCNIADVKED